MKKTRVRKNSKKKKVIIFIVLLLVVLGGVAAYIFPGYLKEEEKTVKKKKVKEPEPVVQIVDENSNSRPYAVMINNNSAVWSYQSGLNEAYMVYELLVEGGITREMALFKDAETSKIASVRSSRHYFLDYALENDAIYVHWGWSPQAQSDIRSLGINNINGLTYEGSYFFRDNNVRAAYEHRGYTSMELLKKAVENIGYRSTTEEKVLLKYNAREVKLDDIEGVMGAETVSIRFSNGYTANFIYDKENKVYLRNQNSTEMKDFTSGERITAKNIITYKASYSLIGGDNKGRLNMYNTGSGDGYYISNGKAIPIKWRKDSRSSKTVYTLLSGEELVVNDGNTYIEINPSGQSTTITAPEPESTESSAEA